MSETLERIHEKNLDFIAKNKLKVGDHVDIKLERGDVAQCQIIAINGFYGWIVAKEINTTKEFNNVDINRITAVYSWVMVSQ